jgi:hypothetical protein
MTASYILNLPDGFRLSQWPRADVDPGPTLLKNNLVFWPPQGAQQLSTVLYSSH